MKRRWIALLLVLAGCRQSGPGFAVIGDAQRGRAMVGRYGCASCHEIPHVAGTGMVGPPLKHMATRLYVAGRFPNVPQNMVQWIRFPQQLKPHNGMPNLGVTDRDARDIAAFLYTLR